MEKEYPRSEAELEAYRLADRLSGRYSVWRSARERACWLRDVRRAQISGQPAAAAYVTATLVDRAETLVKVSAAVCYFFIHFIPCYLFYFC